MIRTSKLLTHIYISLESSYCLTIQLSPGQKIFVSLPKIVLNYLFYITIFLLKIQYIFFEQWKYNLTAPNSTVQIAINSFYISYLQFNPYRTCYEQLTFNKQIFNYGSSPSTKSALNMLFFSILNGFIITRGITHANYSSSSARG